MLNVYSALLVPLALIPSAPRHFQTTTAATVISRMGANYRGMSSYRASISWSRKYGERSQVASIQLLVKRSNRYLLEMKGDKLNTLVLCDGQSLAGVRLDRRCYVKSKAPQFLIGADVLAGIDVPSLSARILTHLLQNGHRDAEHPLSKLLSLAKVETGKGADGAIVLSFPYESSYSVDLTVSSRDYSLQKVVVSDKGAPVITEKVETADVDPELPSDLFKRPIPDGFRLVAELPKIELPAPDETRETAAEFVLKSLDGKTVKLSDLKGKVVLLNFFTTSCELCNEEYPQFARWHDEYADRDLVIVSVNSGEAAEEIKTFRTRSKASFLAGVDPEGNGIAKAYGVEDAHANIVIDRQGKIVAKFALSSDVKGIFVALKKAGLVAE